MQRRGNMAVTCRKVKVLCMMIMMLSVFICILMGNYLQRGPKQRTVRVESFWNQQLLNGSFWNKEQQLLDLIHNPIINPGIANNAAIELPDWLNDTRPLGPCKADYRVTTQIADYNTLPQRFQDFLLYMRCRTYPMLIKQPHMCNEDPFLLLVVKSLTPHFERRQAIRETWGRAGTMANRTMVTVFLLGNSMPVDHFPNLDRMLDYEANLHNDILQWDYRDTFFNLTLKEVLFLEWISQKCPRAQYILKGDDDVFVNTPRIIEFLESLSEDKAKHLFIGDVISNAGPHRDKRLKYFIPESFFEGPYPPYAGGGGYLYSGDIASRLYNISRQIALYPIDDVFTGMCLKKLGLVPEKHKGFRTFDIEEKYRYNPCIYRDLMLVHSRTPQEMLNIWPWIVQPELDCQ